MTDGLTEGQDEPTPPDQTIDLNGPRVLLLGSGDLSRELAIALQRLGAEVIAVDGYSGAPAHRVADQSLVIAMTDADELAAVFGRLQPDFVVTLTDAVSVDGLEALSDSELVPSARSVRLTADREGLRKLAADQLGLPTAPFWFVGSLAELEAVAAHAGFPLLVKPVSGAAGQGQSVVARPDQVERAWRHAVGGAGSRVWAEAAVEVEFLVTMIVVCSDGPAGPVIEFCAPIGHARADAGELESWQPQQMSTAAMDAAKSIAARIVKALGGRGVFSVELMINGDEVYFADVAAHPTESTWVTVRSQRLSVFDLQARAILGLAVDTMMVSPGAARAAVGATPSADALTAALAVPESDVRVDHALGVALATAPDVATARDRARDVATRLNMRDSRG
ncbi:formate-dependent phosphoribosylglycinamide formyltransferase [Mycobacterium riyadhense]|uniref:Phosphoribosylglycinamide formyltransferase n=1 Tax=Mycobacterium riyadhense TaxID=486698 RepID=A0A1X2CGB5_9MYCO|nr:formate-dependent phosphoribosylglycinamide formyltransferase [Mycobacterium riyadhense]ORW74349.1 phosphoribosylglycinamide formyltransferase [Mycobacterium riyadhense]